MKIAMIALLTVMSCGYATNPQICDEIHLSNQELVAADYNGEANEWIAENGDGKIIGYSLQEDSEIYESTSCVERSK
jgi:hypothetical protein